MASSDNLFIPDCSSTESSIVVCSHLLPLVRENLGTSENSTPVREKLGNSAKENHFIAKDCLLQITGNFIVWGKSWGIYQKSGNSGGESCSEKLVCC